MLQNNDDNKGRTLSKQHEENVFRILLRPTIPKHFS